MTPPPLIPDNREVEYRLRIADGELAGREEVVTGELSVGRSAEVGLSLPDRRVSRRHARFYVGDGALQVEDLGTPGGTTVNGQRVRHARLVAGDLVVLGKTTLEVLGGGAEPDRARVERIVDPARRPGLERMAPGEFFTALGIPEPTILDAGGLDLVRRRARDFALLFEVGQAVQSERDPVRLLGRALDLVLKVIPADVGYAGRLVGDRIAPLVARSTRPGVAPRSELSRAVLDHVVGARQAILSTNPRVDERLEASESLMLGEVRAVIAAPMIAGDRVVGVLELDATHLGPRLGEADLDLLALVAAAVGPALDNLRLVGELEATIAELTAAQARLVRSEQLAAVGRLAAGIAHEVKNHLSPFMLAEVLRIKHPDDAEICEAAELMKEAQEHILDLVDEIRTFTRGGPETEELEPHDVAGLVERVIRFAGCDRAMKRARVSLAVQGRPVVDLDARSFRQVVLNLLRNAVDALPEAGGAIEVEVAEADGAATVRVTDHGRGIPPEIQARIFEPFFSTKGERGLGLGLDISRRIVERHRGRLVFHSQPGVGTTFTIELPARATDATDPDLAARRGALTPR